MEYRKINIWTKGHTGRQVLRPQESQSPDIESMQHDVTIVSYLNGSFTIALILYALDLGQNSTLQQLDPLPLLLLMPLLPTQRICALRHKVQQYHF